MAIGSAGDWLDTMRWDNVERSVVTLAEIREQREEQTGGAALHLVTVGRQRARVVAHSLHRGNVHRCNLQVLPELDPVRQTSAH